MGTREIKRYCIVKDDAEKLLETAINKLGLSARAMFFQLGHWPFVLILSFATIQVDCLFLQCAKIRFDKEVITV
jgi:hypothetical protein